MPKTNQGIFVVGAVVTAIGLALYPVAVHPKLFPQKYRKYYASSKYCTTHSLSTNCVRNELV